MGQCSIYPSDHKADRFADKKKISSYEEKKLHNMLKLQSWRSTAVKLSQKNSNNWGIEWNFERFKRFFQKIHFTLWKKNRKSRYRVKTQIYMDLCEIVILIFNILSTQVKNRDFWTVQIQNWISLMSSFRKLWKLEEKGTRVSIDSLSSSLSCQEFRITSVTPLLFHVNEKWDFFRSLFSRNGTRMWQVTLAMTSSDPGRSHPSFYKLWGSPRRSSRCIVWYTQCFSGSLSASVSVSSTPTHSARARAPIVPQPLNL